MAKLSNFNGTCIYDLKESIKDKEELPGAASLLKLLVGEDKEDLDRLQDLVDVSGNCDSSTLFERYNISYRSPIFVEFPGK